MCFSNKMTRAVFSRMCIRAVALGFTALLFSTTGWSRDLPRYAVILSDPAPITVRAQGSAAVEAARTRVLAAQQIVREELRSKGVRVTGSSHTLLNAIFVASEP